MAPLLTDRALLMMMNKGQHSTKTAATSVTTTTEEDVFAPLRSLDMGDILLYRTKDLGAQFNAFAQGSYYSHVSMVVRGTPEQLSPLYPKDYQDSTSELAILEVVPKRGVGLFPLEARLARTIDNISYLSVRRHSGIIADTHIQHFFDNFLNVVLGRELEILTLDMCRGLFYNRFRAKLMKKGNDVENWDKFYCSELTAEALQQLHIMREEGVNSNDLIPASFAPPTHPSKHKDRSFAMPGERITLPGHYYTAEEILVLSNNPLAKALHDKKKQMKEEYKQQQKLLKQQQKQQRV